MEEKQMKIWNQFLYISVEWYFNITNANVHVNKTETECPTEVQRHMGSKNDNSQYDCQAVYAENEIVSKGILLQHVFNTEYVHHGHQCMPELAAASMTSNAG